MVKKRTKQVKNIFTSASSRNFRIFRLGILLALIYKSIGALNIFASVEDGRLAVVTISARNDFYRYDSI